MKLTLATSGLLDPRKLSAWSAERRRAIHAAVAKGMVSGGRDVREAARAQMRSAFQVRRASFVASLQAKVFDQKPERLPACGWEVESPGSASTRTAARWRAGC